MESCSVLAERRAAAEKVAARGRAEVRYAAGDPTLSERDNPLYEDMCAENLEPLRRRLAAGAPPYRMSGLLWKCGVVQPRPDLFQLVMPTLHGKPDQHQDYCDVLRLLHGHRAVPFLEYLVAMKLPLYCDAERRHEWRDGIRPFTSNGSVDAYPPYEQTLAWVQVLVAGGVPVCEPLPSGDTLLNRYVNMGPPLLIELLLKAGCDPRLQPVRESPVGSREPEAYSPRVWWAVRRFIRKPWENMALPVDASQYAAINRLMGEPSAAELSNPDPQSDRTFLRDYGGLASNEPDLLQYLVERGAGDY